MQKYPAMPTLFTDDCGKGTPLCVAERFNQLVVISDEALNVYDLTTALRVHQWPGWGWGSRAHSACMSPAGDTVLVVVSWSNSVDEIHIHTGEQVRSFTGFDGLARHVMCADTTIHVISDSAQVTKLEWPGGELCGHFRCPWPFTVEGDRETRCFLHDSRIFMTGGFPCPPSPLPLRRRDEVKPCAVTCTQGGDIYLRTGLKGGEIHCFRYGDGSANVRLSWIRACVCVARRVRKM
jgi:hypothetical protein